MDIISDVLLLPAEKRENTAAFISCVRREMPCSILWEERDWTIFPNVLVGESRPYSGTDEEKDFISSGKNLGPPENFSPPYLFLFRLRLLSRKKVSPASIGEGGGIAASLAIAQLSPPFLFNPPSDIPRPGRGRGIRGQGGIPLG